MAARRSMILVTLAVAMLAGCTAAPTARLATSAGLKGTPLAPAAPLAPVTAPLVKTIPGFSGPAPTVSVKAGAAPAVAAATVAVAQEATADVVAIDTELEALDLLVDDGSGYQLQGWFQDLKDSIKRAWQRFQLKREVKAALKHRRELAFELHEGEIDTIRKNRTAPVTSVNDLGGGGKEIVTTWTSTNKGTWQVETRRIVDAEGTTQTLSVHQTGTSDKDLRIDLERIRTLMGEDGAYQVVTKRTCIYKDGRQEYAEWTKTVDADGSEKIDGYITHRDGYRTEITGTRDEDGKVKVEVSKIAPAHNPNPLPSASPFEDEDEDEDADEDDEATGVEEDDEATGAEEDDEATGAEEDDEATGA
jgi:hypothetical protein